MTLKEGQRVKLAADVRLTDSVATTGDPSASAAAVAGFLSLGAGTEGTVERVVVEDRPQSQEVREYERLKSLLVTFGHEMPAESRKQLEEQVGSLEPAWIAYQELSFRVVVRVHFDNGLILDDAPEDIFTPA
ncbi:hypothetical protein [Streptomyces sp. NPDC002990]